MAPGATASWPTGRRRWSRRSSGSCGWASILLGAYLALTDTSGYSVGALFAFMMLSQRVAQPLVQLARLIEEYEEVGGVDRPGGRRC